MPMDLSGRVVAVRSRAMCLLDGTGRSESVVRRYIAMLELKCTMVSI